MKLTPVDVNLSDFPPQFYSVLSKASVYDSSCSEQARVLFIDADGGYFLKKSAKGSLKNEAVMTKYFHKKGLSAEVLRYFSDEFDWLMTRKIYGNDCVAEKYMTRPEHLCDKMAELLRNLHSVDFEDCPINRNETFLQFAAKYAKTEEDLRNIKVARSLLKTEALLHGDFCLPNIILNDWQFSGFIDLDCAGFGDIHHDIYWATWTLKYNLKTDKYRQRFYNAYGRDKINLEIIDIIGKIEATVD